MIEHAVFAQQSEKLQLEQQVSHDKDSPNYKLYKKIKFLINDINKKLTENIIDKEYIIKNEEIVGGIKFNLKKPIKYTIKAPKNVYKSLEVVLKQDSVVKLYVLMDPHLFTNEDMLDPTMYVYKRVQFLHNQKYQLDIIYKNSMNIVYTYSNENKKYPIQKQITKNTIAILLIPCIDVIEWEDVHSDIYADDINSTIHLKKPFNLNFLTQLKMWFSQRDLLPTVYTIDDEQQNPVEPNDSIVSQIDTEFMYNFVYWLYSKKILQKKNTLYEQVILTLVSILHYCTEGRVLTYDNDNENENDNGTPETFVLKDIQNITNIAKNITQNDLREQRYHAILSLSIQGYTNDKELYDYTTTLPYKSSILQPKDLCIIERNVRILNTTDIQFKYLFENKFVYDQLYDTILYADIPKEEDRIDHDIINNCINIQEKGLNNRILTLSVRNDIKKNKRIIIRILLNPNHAYKSIEYGPSSELIKESQEFRYFWGSISNLRVFKDGRVLETIIWDKITAKPIYTIPSTICTYIIKRWQLKTFEESSNVQVTIVDPPFDKFLPLVINDTKITNLRNSVDKLQTILLELNTDLPLNITSFVCTHPSVRDTSVFPPIQIPLTVLSPEVHSITTSSTKRQKVNTDNDKINEWINNGGDALDVLITLEYSNQWPKDIKGIYRIRTAFLLKISNLQKEKYNQSISITNNFIDICINRYIFRVRIIIPQQQKQIHTMIDIKEKNLLKSIPYILEDGTLYEQYITLSINSKHTEYINSIRIHFPQICDVIRLFRLWICSHLYGEILTHEICEQQVAYTFTSYIEYQTPINLFEGFLRILHLLSTHDWYNIPIIIHDIQFFTKNNDNTIEYQSSLTKDQQDEIYINFYNKKNTNHIKPNIYIATSYDLGSKYWTILLDTNKKMTQKITDPEQRRQVLISQATLNRIYLQIQDGDMRYTSWEQLFKPPLRIYDSYILLNTKILNSFYNEQKLFTFESTKVAATTTTKDEYKLPLDQVKELDEYDNTNINKENSFIPVYGEFRPVKQYLRDLRRYFNNSIKFYYNPLGGNIIVLEFSKDIFKQDTLQKLKNDQISFKPILPWDEECVIQRDKLIILYICARLGRGIVDTVYTDYSALLRELNY